MSLCSQKLQNMGVFPLNWQSYGEEQVCKGHVLKKFVPQTGQILALEGAGTLELLLN